MNALTGCCLLAVAMGAQLTYLRAHAHEVAADRPPSPSVRWFAIAYPLVMVTVFGVGADLALCAGRWSCCLDLPAPLRAAGIVAMFSGTSVFLWARRSLGEHYSPCFAARRPHAVVRHGAYRWLRHPMYVGNLTTIAGAVLASGSLLLAAAWLVVAVAYTRAAGDENEVLRAVSSPMRSAEGS